jgi:preprotein translocase subunit Sec61beta
MADDKIQMPSSGAGLTRYFDDYKSKIELKPEHVLIIIVVVILIEMLLNWQGNAWFGLQ